MKKIMLSLISVFFLFNNAFAITGVWLLDVKPIEDDKCGKILENYVKKQSKDVKNKYQEKMMNMVGILAHVGAGNIVHMKNNGKVDFYGLHPSKKRKGIPTILNDGKWSKKGKKVEVSPKEIVKGLKLGKFLVTVKDNKAELKIVENKQFIEQTKLLMDNQKFNKCISDFTLVYTKSVTDKAFKILYNLK